MKFLRRRPKPADICAEQGHDIDPDPGDFVLLCRRCGHMVDLYELMGIPSNDIESTEERQ